jgi:hypothetical protein
LQGIDAEHGQQADPAEEQGKEEFLAKCNFHNGQRRHPGMRTRKDSADQYLSPNALQTQWQECNYT